MSKAEQRLVHKKITKEMAQFYQVLGTFNSNMITLIQQNPGTVRDVTDKIREIACTVHDQQCADGHVYDHMNQMCIRLVKLSDSED